MRLERCASSGGKPHRPLQYTARGEACGKTPAPAQDLAPVPCNRPKTRLRERRALMRVLLSTIGSRGDGAQIAAQRPKGLLA